MGKMRLWVMRISGVVAISGTAALAGGAGRPFTLPDFSANAAGFSSFPSWLDGHRQNFVVGQRGLICSSRAMYTFAVNSFDYKYSLRNYDEKNDEYYHVRSQVHLRAAKRILKLCESNRGFYIKAGQFVASLQHIPKEYIMTLSVLQDQALSWPFQAIEKVIVQEFGKSVLDMYSKFEEKPLAAASLAQVHHAVLKDGQEVAVKVQYPGLQQQFEVDIATMTFLSKALAWEGKNAEQTARNFIGKKTVKIPTIYWECSSKRVLTMEFMHGCKVDDIACMKKAHINPLEVAELLVDVFAEMMFCHGYIHGDPHPGNIFINWHDHKGKGNFDLVLLDHGLYRELNEDFRSELCRLWKALILLDSHELEQVGIRLGAGKYFQYLPVMLTGRSMKSKSGLGEGMTKEEAQQLKEEVKQFTMGDISLFMERLPRDFLTVLRTDWLLRSITSKLGADPRSRLMANAKYAVIGLSFQQWRVGREAQGWQAHTKALYEYANLRLRLELFEFTYKLNALYGSLLQHAWVFFMKTVGKFWRTRQAAS